LSFILFLKTSVFGYCHGAQLC